MEEKIERRGGKTKHTRKGDNICSGVPGPQQGQSWPITPDATKWAAVQEGLGGDEVGK